MFKKAILFLCVPVLVLGLVALADWIPEDGHKMHWPQLPDETGWAVNATQPLVLADDFMCMETGWIKDVHFWGAWRHGDEGQITQFVLSLHTDIPADQNPDGYSKPGITLREWEISDWTAVPIDPATMEGWYDPKTNDIFPEDHYAYFQYNVFLPEADWFPQDSGTIYWLNITAIVQDPINTQWGWKSTQDNWNDDAVWAEWGDLSWVEMYEPEVIDTLVNDFNIFIDPTGNFQGGGGGGSHPPGWVLYPDDWWTIWYYDHPLDLTRYKEVLLEYDIFLMDPGQPGFVEIAINWSNEEWPDESAPPDPAQSQFIQRAIVYTGEVVPGSFAFPFDILDYNPVWVSVDVRGYNFEIPMGFITHICTPKDRVSMDLSFVITGDGGQVEIDTCDYYKSPYDDYSPYGMPDFDQKQDLWIYPPSGAWSYCGPVALANCLWWFDSKFEPSPQDPNPFYPDPAHSPNDGYNLVYSFNTTTAWDDHDTNNVMPFVDSMALYCQTNVTGSGTNVFDLAQGARDWIDSVGLSGKYTVRTFPIDPEFGFDQIREEVLVSQDVILLLGFYEDFGGGNCERVGGHFVTVAGTCTDPVDSALCISDPYFDMHEGEPPAGSAHGSSVHNDAANISGPHGTIYHDKYWVVPTTCSPFNPPFFTCELPGYPVNASNVPVWYGQNRADTTVDPIHPQGGPIHTIIEYAVIICPDTTSEPTGACCEPPYGLCHIMTQFECDSAGWFYEGDGTTCTPNPCDSCDYQTPGDVNNDGVTNVSDVTYLINFLYKGGPAPPVMANADPNGDCCIDYRDVNYLIQFLFYAGPPPVNCTCVNPPVCLPTPPDHTPGIVRHNTDGYLPLTGDPTGTKWHELYPMFCENWTLVNWIDNGDGLLSYCDTVEFTHDVIGTSSREHVKLVTATLTLIDIVTLDSLYIDQLAPLNPLVNPITAPIGTFWHEVYPTYCQKYVLAYWNQFTNPSLAVGDQIILQQLPSGATKEWAVAAINTDVITTPVPVLGDEYDHNLDPNYTGGDPTGTNWLELNPNYGDLWMLVEFRPNGTDWLDYCDTLKFVSETMPDSVLWKHVLAATWTMKLFDGTDTLYMDYMMVNPMYPMSSQPIGTWWHEIWPTFCLEAQIVNWTDNGTGYIDSCDWVDIEFISGPDSGNVITYHVEAFQVDIVTEIIDDPSSCCMPPIRGNMDMDAADQIDISDLVYIVDYMFTGGPAPTCWAEANIDCSDDGNGIDGPEDIDISDLVYLVDYMFNGGPTPCRCDCSDCP